PRVDFRPPPCIALQPGFLPRARVDGDTEHLTAEAVFVVGGLRTAIPMQPGRKKPGWLLGSRSFVPPYRPPGTLVDVHVEWQDGDVERRTAVHTLELSDVHCIDAGDDDDFHLAEATPGCRVVRFVDGRENALRAGTGAHFVYDIPVPEEASAVAL